MGAGMNGVAGFDGGETVNLSLHWSSLDRRRAAQRGLFQSTSISDGRRLAGTRWTKESDESGENDIGVYGSGNGGAIGGANGQRGKRGQGGLRDAFHG